MATPLNLYATKVFAEQPLGLWPLDDRADYVSFLSTGNQDLATWTRTGVTSVVDATLSPPFTQIPPSIPFREVKANGIIGAANNNGLITFTSPNRIQPTGVDATKETFSFGLYIYSFQKILNVRLGFRYFDTVLEEICENINGCVIKPAGSGDTFAWAFVSETFNLPQNFADLELIIEIYYESDNAPYEFAINALTAGQWAEEFQVKSLGASLIDVPSNINIPETKGLTALTYGLPTNNGYYIAENNFLLAKNFGIPLVYGSRNSTYITPKEGSPSLIVPAFGFLNRAGQFNNLTAEFWIKIQSNAIESRKIFGPISSDDGLYVEGPFLKLKIGNLVQSHYVREWDRPMLIDIRVTPTSAVLIINGDQVINMDLDPRSYSFVPSEDNEKDQDWLGFYAYSDVPLIQLDCIAIYPYEVSAIVAKRKWVYGQGVQVPTDIKGSDSTLSVFVDYPFSKYAKNYYFPSSSRWSSGSIENLTIQDDSVRPTEHPVPEVRFSDRDSDQWLTDLMLSQDPSNPILSLRPSEDWDGIEGHFFLRNLNFLSTQTRGFYGVFESSRFYEDPQTLFQITNLTNANTLKIYTKGDILSYETAEVKKVSAPSGFRRYRIRGFPQAFRNDSVVNITYFELDTVAKDFNWNVINVISDEEFEIEAETGITETVLDNDFVPAPDLKIIHESTVYYTFITKLPAGPFKEEIFYTSPGQKIGQRYFVGLDIPRFVRSEGKQLANFIGTRQNLAVYIAGTQDLTETFVGDIHRIGFCTERNLNKISHLFNEDGFPIDYVNVFNSFGPNIFDAGSQYFEDDLDVFGNALTPPPAFWSLILDGGDPYDFASITAEEHIASYTLVPKNYFGRYILDIATDSYWEDYVPLSYFSKRVRDGRGNLRPEVTFIQFNVDYPTPKVFDGDTYDTSNAIVKTYVAFQYLRSGSNAITNSFKDIQPLNKTKIVRPDANWLNTKYEVIDGTVIYPPVDVDPASLSLNVYLEMVVDGININPVRIRSIQLSSQSYGHSPNKIGTRFGTDLVPYTRSQKYFNYKLAPSLAIYKDSTPYLYNTANSGIELKIPYSNKNIQGISMPINKTAANFFKIGSMQMSLRYGEELFPEFPIKVFELAHKTGQINFFLVADSPSRKRGQIYAVNEITGRLQSNLMFYINGVPTKRPVLYPNTWAVVGISFPAFLNFAESVGALRITSPIMFNNISYFQTTFADDEERFGFRQWFAVRSQLGEPLEWGFWAGKEVVGEEVVEIPGLGSTWREVLFLSSILREELDASNIYNIFTGTERIISDVDTYLPITGYQYNIYRNLRWSPRTVTPV
jgi:hypothetical protein